jgi:NAD(P)-dependent dehydrogenase (short-subunit alcohol dehydrogenase family)
MAKGEDRVPSLAGRVAIVTGAGKGLGRAYALKLAEQGARVLVNNRVREGEPSSADRVVEEITGAGGIALADYSPVEHRSAGDDLVAHALDGFGALDIVVANAGLDRPRSFHKQAWEAFDEIVRINFLGAARLLHAAWPRLRQRDTGRALVSVSTAGLYGNHGQAAYAASKAALVGLVKSLAIECAGSGLRINALAPYAVTPLTEPWFPRADADRFRPAAVADLAAWLVSSACHHNGAVLVSGGGGVRLAGARETSTVSLQDGVEAALGRLEQLDVDQAPESASAEFEAFAHSLPGEEPS